MATTIGNGVVDYNTAEAEAKKKLVANQLKINSDPNYVASEQQRALQVIAERQKQGLDVTGQQKYLTQQLGYKAPAANTAVANRPISTPVAAPTASTKKNNSQQGSEYLEQMKAIANRTITPYSYNADADPAYQSALKRAAANIETGNSQAQAEMNRRGILNSTITSDRMGEIASQEMGNVETTIVPQLMQADYQRYLDTINQQQQQFSNLGALANTSFSEDQRGIDNKNTTASMTGYLPGGEEAQGLVSQLLSLKQQAETKGITAAERNKLSNQADGIRAMLTQMGVDASQYSSGVNYNTASQVAPTIRTLAGQDSDRAAQAQQYNQAMTTRQQDTSDKQYTEQFAYQKARDAISDKQWQTKFDEDVRQNGLSYALQSLSQQNDQSYRQAQLALSQDDNSRAWASLDYDMSQPSSSGSNGLTANQVLSSIQGLYTEPTYITDPLTQQQSKTGERITQDPAKRKQMFLSVVDSNLDDAATNQILSSLGMTKDEIAKYTKEYSGK